MLRVLAEEDAAFVLEGVAEAVVFVEDAFAEDERMVDDLVGAAATTVATAVVEKTLLLATELDTSSESSHS